MFATVQCYMGWEGLIICLVSIVLAFKIYFDTANALFTSAGIVDYWRKGKGPEDPYDLDVLVQAFSHQAQNARDAWDDIEAAANGQGAQSNDERACAAPWD